jgi:hypothetical protein
MADQANEPPRLPLVEAAVKLGKSTEAVRSLIRRGRLKAMRGNSGTLLVEVPPDLVRSDDRSNVNDDRMADVMFELDHWREAAHLAEVAQARAEAERDAARATAAAETAAKDQVIGELRAMLGEMRAELAEARRPWWRRLMAASLLTGFIVTANPANAQSNSMDLLLYCKKAVEIPDSKTVEIDQLVQGISCNSYMRGFINGWIQRMASENGVEPYFCLPTSGTYEQYVNVYVRWAETHPERLHLESNRTVHEALAEAFPCR